MTRQTTTDRMRQAIDDRLTALLGRPVSDIKLYPARGYWRQTKADVQQFTGSATVDGVLRSIGCWESMSDCLRYGFEIHDFRGQPRTDADFVVEAKGRRNIR